MIKIYYALLIIIILITTWLLVVKVKINSLEYNNLLLKGFLDESTIESMKRCFTSNTKESINCYARNQRKIFDNLKKKVKSNYISIDLARWSDGSKNFDAQTFHRDIKPNLLKHKGKYPKVYTFICYLDKAQHIQGGIKYTMEPGDCLLFSSFNLHKGVNMKFDSNKRRRVIQFFGIFFDEKEKIEFYKKHSNAEHYNNDFWLKTVHHYIETRSGFELFNLVPLILPMKLYEPNKNTYVTLVDKSQLFATVDNVKYYKKF